jgi:glutaredoxin
VKAWLSRAGVPFTVRDVDEDDRAYDELIALGFRSIPITVIGEQRIRGFNPAAMTAALTAAGAG